jgi:predicted acylesterase/phospholipase RssA/flagellar biogenesis protein FliO
MDGELEQAPVARVEIHQTGSGWPLVIHETVLPLAVAVATVAIFLRLGQAHEVLFGTIGPAPHSGNGVPRPNNQYIGTQFYALVAAIGLIGTAVWYSARLLLTVDRTNRSRTTSNPKSSRAIEIYPRLIGAMTSAVLIIALIVAQEGGLGSEHPVGVIVALLAALLPLGAAIYLVRRRVRGWRWAAAWSVLAVSSWCFVILSRPGHYDLSVIGAMSMLCYLPAMLYAIFTLRRSFLRRVGFNPQAADTSLHFTWSEAVLRLFAMGFGGAFLLGLLAAGPLAVARVLGSSAIVLLAVMALLCTLCAFTLAVRRLAHNKPGYGLIGVTALVSLYLFLHGTVGWSPFEERMGREELATKTTHPLEPRRLQDGQMAKDVVVNAYGGGLRAALFTAQVLADLDDRSCGEFGRRLERLSGVSGGSLGIAVYMLLRQEFVASGGWINCTPANMNASQLAQMVEDTLAQDHLSASLARMLSTDILPFTPPRRGQALLDSWQEAMTTVLSSRALAPGGGAVSLAGLALPLGRLDGGVWPAPAVYFNATEVSSGKRVWFSNRRGGIFSSSSGPQDLEGTYQVGQAVLHSARFPVVSPAGRFAVGTLVTNLVDGGYADNSGASTLFDTNEQKSGRHWLNIDGNPPEPESKQICAQADATPPQADAKPPQADTKPPHGFFSGIDTLLAVRESQAELAVGRFLQTGATYLKLKPNLEDAFKESMPNEFKRCEFVRALHAAPLGWYMTPVTVGDQLQARKAAVKSACDALQPLCGR